MLQFSNRSKFRKWLFDNHETSGGLYLVFGKKGGPSTLTAHEALEEALCFGWIDGVIISIDDTKYKKYFARRNKKSNWSIKNKKIAQDLIERNIMTKAGFDAIEKAKENGMWDIRSKDAENNTIEDFKVLIRNHKEAYKNYLTMPFSAQRAYSAYYYEAKTEVTREKRLESIIERLNNNIKPSI